MIILCYQRKWNLVFPLHCQCTKLHKTAKHILVNVENILQNLSNIKPEYLYVKISWCVLFSVKTSSGVQPCGVTLYLSIRAWASLRYLECTPSVNIRYTALSSSNIIAMWFQVSCQIQSKNTHKHSVTSDDKVSF